eukprot:TRINITY_DN54720_c0_g1_i1.p1 TRINITY_DN54720_c0_g1~~TRINITY_DN54720_c0_g1_i1.p1  ORF type:complete len:355 (-),score=39.63 TRINITY_DN54720_c0_g1_i1:253-1317(-)
MLRSLVGSEMCIRDSRSNMTVYRMTPFGVLDMGNKDTGDAPGDTSFVLSRKTASYECMKHPDNPGCSTVTRFTGDVPNSTDLVLAFEVELDGAWGPYLQCNPVNTSEPLGAWACQTDATPNPKDWAPQCSAAGFAGREGYCLTYPPSDRPTAASLGECCNTAHRAGSPAWTFDASTNSSCALYTHLNDSAYKLCTGGVIGFYEPSCKCPRVHRAVGRVNLTSIQGPDHPAGGIWFSHPSAGECAPGEPLGSQGCTWRVIRRKRAINASCMYNRIDTVVEDSSRSCFQACPQPKNSTSDCYLACYANAVSAMPTERLVAPWYEAFVQPHHGGCPEVPLRPHSRTQRELQSLLYHS